MQFLGLINHDLVSLLEIRFFVSMNLNMPLESLWGQKYLIEHFFTFLGLESRDIALV